MRRKQTYEVNIHADALRTVRVRATSGAEAMEIAAARAGESRSGAWTINYPGSADEHFSVRDGSGEWIGPDGNDKFTDEDEGDESEPT
jgi:hypothetical protein